MAGSMAAVKQALDFVQEFLATTDGDETDKEAAEAALIQRCGALPGEAESRVLIADANGWQVTVSVGEDVRVWRCIDGAWIETTSEQ